MESEQKVERVEKRVQTVEEAIILLKELTISHDDRLEKFLFGLEELRAGQKETNEKINMLIDAQIRTEDKISTLTDAVLSAHQRIDKIEE